MSHYTVLFDGNLLYPAPIRDALIQLAEAELFKTKWAADIHRGWIDARLCHDWPQCGGGFNGRQQPAAHGRAGG